MTSLLTGLALRFPLHHSNSPSLDALPRRPTITSPPPPSSPRPSVLLFPTTCTFSVAIPHRAYIDALMRTLTRAQRVRTFMQPRIEHRLPALTGRVQRSLGSHRLALSRPGRSAWSSPLSFSLFLTLSFSLSLSLAHTLSHRVSPRLSRPSSPPTLRISFCLFLPLVLSFCPPSLLFFHL